MTLTYELETLQLARERLAGIEQQIYEEVIRLLQSGAVDPHHHNRSLLFGVAVENIADRWLQGERNKKDYKNLKHF